MIYDLITSFEKSLNLYVVSKSTNKHRLKVCLVKAAQNYEQNQKQYSGQRSREFFTNFVTHYQVSLDEIFGILPMANRILRTVPSSMQLSCRCHATIKVIKNDLTT